jgi:hypothetical protein
LRLTNAFGAQPVTFGAVHVAVQQAGAAIVSGCAKRRWPNDLFRRLASGPLASA